VSFYGKPSDGISYWLKRAWWEERWSVGLIDDDAFWRCVRNGILADTDVSWLASRRKSFLADPCWLSEDESTFTAECVDYRRRIGRLVLARVSGGRSVVSKTIKASDFHYSYPMVHRSEGKYLIIPESAESASVYAITVDSTGCIIGEMTILSGARLVDPTVFFHGGCYWLFANPLDTFDNELRVFRAEAINGPWRETLFSPLWIPNCRGAGNLFQENGTLYWPTQYNSEHYGGGVVLRKIVSITDTQLKHEVVSVILPDPNGSRPNGFHTFSKGQQRHLVDGLRFVFSPLKPINVLLARATRWVRSSRTLST
jgi:hypothetical protein